MNDQAAELRELPAKFQVAFSFAGEQRELVKNVAIALEEILGYGTVFYDEWFEHVIAGHDADLELQQIYRERSDLVVVCVSERYGNKPWTRMEHETIREIVMAARTSSDKRDRHRILPLRVGDGNVPGLPATVIAPDIRNTPPAKTAEFIARRLKLVRRPNVYLAECTPDLDEKRDRVKTFLTGIGWSVLPATAYEDHEYLERLRADLSQSLAFVQLLGPFPWRRGGYDHIQYDAAKALNLRCYRFRSPDIKLADVESTHRQFLDGEGVIKSGFEDFKTHLQEELKVLREQFEQPPRTMAPGGSTPLVRVVIRSPNPDPLWDRIFAWVYSKEKLLASQIHVDENLEEKQLVEPCHGFLVVCDKNALEEGPYSTRGDMEQCRKIQLKEKDRKRRPPVGLIYWPPPESERSWPRLLRSIPDKLYPIDGASPKNLNEFFAEVRRVAQ